MEPEKDRKISISRLVIEKTSDGWDFSIGTESCQINIPELNNIFNLLFWKILAVNNDKWLKETIQVRDLAINNTGILQREKNELAEIIETSISRLK